MVKKWSTDQRFILKEITSQKIHTLRNYIDLVRDGNQGKKSGDHNVSEITYDFELTNESENNNSLVFLPCQLMKCQLIGQKLVRKLLFLVCCFSQ